MDSGFHFWLMELGFWIQIVNRIPDPTSKFFPDSGLHKKKFPVFRECRSLYMGKNAMGEFIERHCLLFLLDH